MSKNKVSDGKHILRGHYLAKKWRRNEDAEERIAERQKRTAMQQYALLDSRLGKGAGARKERERLLRQAISEREFALVKMRHRANPIPTK